MRKEVESVVACVLGLLHSNAQTARGTYPGGGTCPRKIWCHMDQT